MAAGGGGGREGWIQCPRGSLGPAESQGHSEAGDPRASLPLLSAGAQQAEISTEA